MSPLEYFNFQFPGVRSIAIKDVQVTHAISQRANPPTLCPLSRDSRPSFEASRYLETSLLDICLASDQETRKARVNERDADSDTEGEQHAREAHRERGMVSKRAKD
jgi:hypothetical protein